LRLNNLESWLRVLNSQPPVIVYAPPTWKPSLTLC
jgi:hypothetical protein